MASTYTPIATTNGTGASKVITFSSIPSTYTDIKLVANYELTGSILNAFTLQFNSDTASNYSYTKITGNGTSATSSRATSQTSLELGDVSSANVVNTLLDIQNYANTTTFKTVLSRNNDVGYAVYAYVGLWRSTSAINSITLSHQGGASNYFTTGSTFTLYGIKAA